MSHFGVLSVNYSDSYTGKLSLKRFDKENVVIADCFNIWWTWNNKSNKTRI